MITLHEAVTFARQEVENLYVAQDIQIEEYAADPSRPYWLITLSFQLPTKEANNPWDLIPQRKWKTLRIRQDNGAVDAMIAGGVAELIK
jgi:hypothetical protein